MDGRNTIIIMLEAYFETPLVDDGNLDGICDVLLSGLIDEGYEITPSYLELKAEIEFLARAYSPNTQNNFGPVENGLWTFLVNWWDTVKWARQKARQEIRASSEKEDLIADIVNHIKDQILNHVNQEMKESYSYNTLQALIQLTTPPDYAVDSYVDQIVVSQNINLNDLLPHYQELGRVNGFGDEVRILLKFLHDKMIRNSNSHAKFKVQEYRRYCIDSNTPPSFYDFIEYRGLNIYELLLPHCERLFNTTFRFD